MAIWKPWKGLENQGNHLENLEFWRILGWEACHQKQICKHSRAVYPNSDFLFSHWIVAHWMVAMRALQRHNLFLQLIWDLRPYLSYLSVTSYRLSIFVAYYTSLKSANWLTFDQLFCLILFHLKSDDCLKFDKLFFFILFNFKLYDQMWECFIHLSSQLQWSNVRHF